MVLYEIRPSLVFSLRFKAVILRFRPQKCCKTLYFGEKITFLLVTKKKVGSAPLESSQLLCYNALASPLTFKAIQTISRPLEDSELAL